MTTTTAPLKTPTTAAEAMLPGYAKPDRWIMNKQRFMTPVFDNAPAPVAVSETPTNVADDVAAMNRDDLRKLAREIGLAGYSKLNKGDLATAILVKMAGN